MNLEDLVERIKTNSVMNPLLWLCGITEALCIPAALATKGGIQIAFFGLASLPVIFSLAMYAIWMGIAPDRLQSEDYRLNRQRLMQGTKEENLLTVTHPTSNYVPMVIAHQQSSAPDLPETEIVDVIGVDNVPNDSGEN